MSTVLEKQGEAIQQGPYVEHILQEVREESDAAQQIYALDSRRVHKYIRLWEHETSPEAFRALIDFAADEQACSSAVVRVEALERALELELAVQPWDSPVRERDLVDAVRDEEGLYKGKQRQQGLAYRYVSFALLRAENIPDAVFFPPETEQEIDSRSRYPNFSPALAYDFLDRCRDELKSGNPSPEAVRFAPLIERLHQKLADYHQISPEADLALDDWQGIAACQRLLSYGKNYSEVFNKLVLSPRRTEEKYIQIIGELSRLADGASRAFPERYEKGVRRGMEHLLADALYGILHHLGNGRVTNVRLALGENGPGLPLRLRGNEPYSLLKKLRKTFAVLEGLQRPIYTISTTENDEFALFRYTSWQGLQPMSAYIRPLGGTAYDNSLEYGRKDGVEASISYVVDTNPSNDRLLELGKHRGKGDDERISIRLDREGRRSGDLPGAPRDPRRQEGTLSLDVGSILGRDDWTSTKLGRFLAWGNALRAASMGTETHFNHMTTYFTPEDGKADIFAEEAEKLACRLEQCRLSEKEIRELFAGRLAVAGVRSH